MALEFKLPDIGEGTVEGEVVRWLVEVGQSVEADQPVVEVMTDKATVELTAPTAGVITETRANPGDVVPVGDILYVLNGGGAQAAGGGDAAAATAVEAPAAPAPTAPTPPMAAPAGGDRKKPLATPATRKLARELGVELAGVDGTGPAGRITKQDVERAASPAAPAPAAAPTPAPTAPVFRPRAIAPGTETTERIPFRGVRKAISQAMVRSKFTAPHFCFVEECDMSEVVALRAAEKERLRAQGIKLSYLPFIIKAVVEGLKAYPIVNSTLDEQRGEIELRHYYHIGLSIDAPAGLSVGVVKHADQRTIAELAVEIDRLVTAVRSGKAKREDLTGSTFTITSAGNIGGILATPIINHPEVAILGVNAIRKRPVIVEGPDGDEIDVRHMMYLSGSYDHRVVDGAVAARFTKEVIHYLEKPSRLLLGA
jgi:pyruvate dehydrogenase E2 component (dihydrolipoamide acetyltransferase)